MSKYLRIRDDLMQKVGVGKDGRVDLLEFASISNRIEECLVCLRKRIKILSTTVICVQLRAMAGSKWSVLHCNDD